MADVKHAVYNSDNVSATTDGSLIVSMKYMGSGSAATAIDNGNVVLVGELMAGEKQIHKATTPAANSPRAQLLAFLRKLLMVHRRRVTQWKYRRVQR